MERQGDSKTSGWWLDPIYLTGVTSGFVKERIKVVNEAVHQEKEDNKKNGFWTERLTSGRGNTREQGDESHRGSR